MGRRDDDFRESTVRFLGDQVGHRCSNPKCGAPTLGPGDPDGLSNVGVAAHINAASKNGPRPNENLTSEQRRHADNGIHLCQSCGKLVDDATSVHTAAQLRQWKHDAILRARQALVMREIDPDGRLKLRREAQLNLAVRTVRLTYATKGHFGRFEIISPRLWGADKARALALGSMISEWVDAHRALEKEQEAMIQDLLTHWGRIPVVELVFKLRWWTQRLGYEAAHLQGRGAGLSEPYDPHTEDPVPWIWSAYFQGTENGIASVHRALDEVSNDIDAWAVPFIPTRD